jgi:Acetyl xylan esterase (AXE1)
MNIKKIKKCLLFLSLFLIGHFGDSINAQDKHLSVFDSYQSPQNVWMKYTDNSKALYRHIAVLAEDCLNNRHKKILELNSREEWNDYLREREKSLYSGVDEFEKTPLNASTTGRLERDSYSVEKVVFESIPGFHVTGCLFIPKKGQLPLPAVLVAIGHSQAAFRRDLYQQNILNLVNKGFIVFTFDPLGQGERVQYFDPVSNQSLIGGSTSEHSYAGASCLLVGNSISDYFIWDGVRAVDYLSSRPEVDSSRIGMTGISGGGTITAFLSAYDKRIHAAAPECYITSYQRLFESIGPQDAEQNPYRGLKRGFDHADLLSLRAPKPTMMITATQDFFSIQGARETFEEAKDVFDIYGSPGNLTMVEADGTHGTKKDSRENMYRFFREHLNLPGSIDDLVVDYFSEDELTVTSTGQISTSYKSKTIFDINREKAVRVLNNRLVKTPGDLEKNKKIILEKVQELSGYDSSRTIKSVVYTGKIEKESYKIEKYFIESADFDYPIPFVFIKPYTDEKRPLVLYLDPAGKAGLLNNQEEIEGYVKAGYSVLAPDLLGTGELANNSFKGDSYIKDLSINLWIGANLVGESIAGLQASDLEILFQHIRTRIDVNIENITAVAKNEICSSYLHFAVFNKGIKKTILINPLISYEDIVFTRYYDPRYLWTAVPGAIQYYDLPFIESLLSPAELVIIDPVSAVGDIASPGAVDKQLLILRETYRSDKAEKQLKIDLKSDKGIERKIRDYL